MSWTKNLPIKRLNNIVDIILNDFVKENGFIAGGFARYTCSPNNEPIPTEDIDIFAYNEKCYKEIEKAFEYRGYEVITDTSTALTYEYKNRNSIYKVQLVKTIIDEKVRQGTVTDIIEDFDFTVIRGAIYLDKGKIKTIFDDDFYLDERNLQLQIKHINCPVRQVLRISDYLQKGYSCSIEDILKVFNEYASKPEYYTNKALDITENGLLTKDTQTYYPKKKNKSYKDKLVEKFPSGIKKDGDTY